MTNWVFVGAYEENGDSTDRSRTSCQQGRWKWADGSPWDCSFMDPLLRGTMNNGEDEDQMAYCGQGCLNIPGRASADASYWTEGFYDVGRRDSGTVSEHFACRIPEEALSTVDATPCAAADLRTELAQMTRSSAQNKGVTLASGEQILVYPMALVFGEPLATSVRWAVSLTLGGAVL